MSDKVEIKNSWLIFPYVEILVEAIDTLEWLEEAVFFLLF